MQIPLALYILLLASQTSTAGAKAQNDSAYTVKMDIIANSQQKDNNEYPTIHTTVNTMANRYWIATVSVYRRNQVSPTASTKMDGALFTTSYPPGIPCGLSCGGPFLFAPAVKSLIKDSHRYGRSRAFCPR